MARGSGKVQRRIELTEVSQGRAASTPAQAAGAAFSTEAPTLRSDCGSACVKNIDVARVNGSRVVWLLGIPVGLFVPPRFSSFCGLNEVQA